MTVRVGVIGTGMIGEDHVRRLTTVVAGAAVTAVTDVDKDRAAAVAERFGIQAVHATGEDVIGDPGVDAVLRGVLGADARGVRARLDRGRQTRLL